MTISLWKLSGVRVTGEKKIRLQIVGLILIGRLSLSRGHGGVRNTKRSISHGGYREKGEQ
jgi:hypothetical protein